MRIRTASPDETRALATRLGALLQAGDVLVLAGELGTGKTTFTQGLAIGLGISARVTSPTFTIVQEYPGPVPLVHVDVYRLERVQEVHDLGLDEHLGDAVVVVEWGDVLGPLLPAERLDVRLEADPDDEHARVIDLVPHGTSWANRPLAGLAAAGERSA